MWVYTEDGTAAVNLDHCFLVLIRSSDTGHGVMAYRDRGDMGTLLRVCDSEEEAKRFVNAMLASQNGRRSENSQH